MSTRSRSTVRRLVAGGGLVAAGALAGGILAGTLTAGAATPDTGSSAATSSSTGSSASSAGTGGQQQTDPSKPQRPDETLLTGDTKSKVEAAVLARYPGATIQRTETDSDGVYESHVITQAGQHLIVQVGSDYAVTGTQTGGGAGGGHRGGPRDGGTPPGGSGSGTGSGSGSGSGEGGA